MNWKPSEMTRLGVVRAFAGMIGGYTWGLVQGLFSGLGFREALHVGGETILVGLIAGMAGHTAWEMMTRLKPVYRYALVIGVVGSVFTGVSSLVVSPEYRELLNVSGSPILDFIGGAVAGAFGGLAAYAAQILIKVAKTIRAEFLAADRMSPEFPTNDRISPKIPGQNPNFHGRIPARMK